jgi:hypothetical protein
MLRVILFCLISVSLGLFAAACPAAAAEHENVLLKLPKGYKVAFTSKTDKELTTEMVPETQSVDNWTEMVKVQTFYDLRDVTPMQYRARVEKLLAESCPGVVFAKVKDGTENLYPMAAWTQTCPLSKTTGKPEVIWMKGVQGRESFHLVQKAFRFDPSPKQIKAATILLDDARVCDTRVPGQRCKPK